MMPRDPRTIGAHRLRRSSAVPPFAQGDHGAGRQRNIGRQLPGGVFWLLAALRQGCARGQRRIFRPITQRLLCTLPDIALQGVSVGAAYLRRPSAFLCRPSRTGQVGANFDLPIARSSIIAAVFGPPSLSRRRADPMGSSRASSCEPCDRLLGSLFSEGQTAQQTWAVGHDDAWCATRARAAVYPSTGLCGLGGSLVWPLGPPVWR